MNDYEDYEDYDDAQNPSTPEILSETIDLIEESTRHITPSYVEDRLWELLAAGGFPQRNDCPEDQHQDRHQDQHRDQRQSGDQGRDQAVPGALDAGEEAAAALAEDGRSDQPQASFTVRGVEFKGAGPGQYGIDETGCHLQPIPLSRKRVVGSFDELTVPDFLDQILNSRREAAEILAEARQQALAEACRLREEELQKARSEAAQILVEAHKRARADSFRFKHNFIQDALAESAQIIAQARKEAEEHEDAALSRAAHIIADARIKAEEIISTAGRHRAHTQPDTSFEDLAWKPPMSALVVVGRSGSGKSALIRTMLGWPAEVPDDHHTTATVNRVVLATALDGRVRGLASGSLPEVSRADDRSAIWLFDHGRSSVLSPENVALDRAPHPFESRQEQTQGSDAGGVPVVGRFADDTVGWVALNFRYLLAGDNAMVRVWNPDTGQQVGELADYADWVRAAALDPGDCLLAAGGNAPMRLWEASHVDDVHAASRGDADRLRTASDTDGCHDQKRRPGLRDECGEAGLLRARPDTGGFHCERDIHPHDRSAAATGNERTARFRDVPYIAVPSVKVLLAGPSANECPDQTIRVWWCAPGEPPEQAPEREEQTGTTGTDLLLTQPRF